MSAGPLVVLVTDPQWPLAHVEEVIVAAAAAVPPGALALQLRDKRAALSDLARAAHALRATTERAGVLFVVNAPDAGTQEIARQASADGVHVPCDAASLAAARDVFGWISTPAHVDDDVVTARNAGADAILVSPIWATPGKGAPRGTEALTRARACAGPAMRVYALGGVDAARAPACAASGADGVAVIRALLALRDMEVVALTARSLAAAFSP